MYNGNWHPQIPMAFSKRRSRAAVGDDDDALRLRRQLAHVVEPCLEKGVVARIAETSMVSTDERVRFHSPFQLPSRWVLNVCILFCSRQYEYAKCGIVCQ